MLHLRHACLLLALCWSTVLVAADHDTITKKLVASSSWINQLGSTMTITSVDPTTGQIAGTYKSPSGTSGATYPLIGWINSVPPVPGQDNVVVISFSVSWGTIGSVTAWNGYVRLVGGQPTITGQWILSSANTTFSWNHLLTNQDTFVPAQ